MKLMKRMMTLVLVLSLLTGAADAEDSFIIDVDALDMACVGTNDYVAKNLTSSSQGILVQKYIGETETSVHLTIVQKDENIVVYDRDYGAMTGFFFSGDIYLPFVDNRSIPYLVTLTIGGWVYAFPYIRLQPRMTDNSGCTFGLRFSDLNGGLDSRWLMGTMLNLENLRAVGTQSVPLCAGNLYIVGSAQISLQGEQLVVALSFVPSANVELQAYGVYLLTDVNTLSSVDPRAMAQPSYALGQPIDVTGCSTALLYIPMTLSYNPAGLSRFVYDLWADGELQNQLNLWNQNLMQGAAPVVDEQYPEELDPQWIEQDQPTFEPTPEAAAQPLPEAAVIPDVTAELDVTPDPNAAIDPSATALPEESPIPAYPVG